MSGERRCETEEMGIALVHGEWIDSIVWFDALGYEAVTKSVQQLAGVACTQLLLHRGRWRW